MDNSKNEKPKNKSFFSRMFEKLDKKIEEKSKAASCCSNKSDKGQNKCCS